MQFLYERPILNELSKLGINVEENINDISFSVDSLEEYHEENGFGVIYKGDLIIDFINSEYLRYFKYTLDSFENIPEQSTCILEEEKGPFSPPN